MTKRFMGVDPSTYTALVTIEPTLDRHHSRLLNFPGETGLNRAQLIANGFAALLQEAQPEVVMIEGYAYGNAHTLAILVEVGTLLRVELRKFGAPWYIAPPSVLKKWTTGKGNAKKSDMAASVSARWGFAHKSDDIIDAYALARLAEEHHHRPVKGIEHG